MIIVDMNQVVISNFMVQVGKFTNIDIDLNMFRHMVVNSVRAAHKKHAPAYGEMVLAFDGPSSWRKDVFPYYKAGRKKSREASDINWSQIFDYMNQVRDEFMAVMPYPVIHMERAEADDIIGTLVRHKVGERILILSADKDFIQLQTQPFVDQYDPIRKVKIEVANPREYYFEHIIRGDSGDGIPNILTQDDTFVIGKRSKSITQTFLTTFINTGYEGLDEATKTRYKRNETLIDLTRTPKELQDKIIESYESQRGKTRAKLLNYFIENRMNQLTELIGDF